MTAGVIAILGTVSLAVILLTAMVVISQGNVRRWQTAAEKWQKASKDWQAAAESWKAIAESRRR